MSDNRNDPIRTAPVELHERLYGLDERLAQVQRELTDIHHEYAHLHHHPDALDVDDLGEPLDPLVATEVTMHGLERANAALARAENFLSTVRGQYAGRLKLTDAAAEELNQHRTRRTRIERTR
ncbi:hypothetical protein ACFXHA_38875 [Nocardia sp. NPDC059240]|uniref:hypothetical protein n=1 Tax=Nocardia sp. NPDC059240 TaxID=3346786 RepID=UPI0036BFBB7F